MAHFIFWFDSEPGSESGNQVTKKCERVVTVWKNKAESCNQGLLVVLANTTPHMVVLLSGSLIFV